MSLLSLSLYCFIGCAEWGLAVARTVCCARGLAWYAAMIVFVEQMAGLTVLRFALESDSWLAFIAYSLGGALGTFVVVKRGSVRRDNPWEPSESS